MFAAEIVRAVAKTASREARLEDDAATSLTPTIFHEAWWMKLASGGTYEQVTVASGGGIVGCLPFVRLGRIPGVTRIGMPLLTHVLGPALAPEFSETAFPRSLKRLSIIRELIAQLPRASSTSFRLHGGITDTLAFGEAGFATHADFTVEIPPRRAGELWPQLRGKTRNVIRRAGECLTVSEQVDAETFVDFYEKNLGRRGLVNHYDRKISTALITESLFRGRGRLLAACDAGGVMQSAIFTVWDHRAEYYFMSTRAVNSMNGATSLLIWHAIQHAGQSFRRFDMDMVHVQQNRLPNLRLLTGFGGVIKPRYFVRRASAMVKIASVIKNIVAS